MPNRKPISPLLAASLELPRREPTKPCNRYGEGLDTKRQAKLQSAANSLLAKSGYFHPKAELNPQVPAECIGTHGLRPSWHGKA